MEKATPVTKKRSLIRRLLRVVLWILVWLLGIVVFLLIAIQTQPVQNFAKKQIVKYVVKKVGTPFSVDRLSVDFPKAVVLQGVYAEDQFGDTMLAAGKVKVDIGMFGLLSNEVNIGTIDLEGITAKVSRDSLGVFNFDYFIEALTGPADTTAESSAPMKISLGDIVLNNFRVRYIDDFAGYSLNGSLQHFDTKFKGFDLDSMRFAIDGANLSGVNAFFRQYKPLAPQIEEDKPVEGVEDPQQMPDLTLGPIALESINVLYENDIEKVESKVALGKLLVHSHNTDLRNQKIVLDKIVWDSTTGSVTLGPSPAAKEVAKKVAETVDTTIDKASQLGWVFEVKELDLQNINFRFDDNNVKPQARGIDYSHLDLQNFEWQGRNVFFRDDSTSAVIEHLSVREKSGLDIRELKGELLYTASQAYLNNFQLRTPGTSLQYKLGARYPSLEAVAKNINTLYLDAVLEDSRVAMSDVLIFQPELASEPFFANNRNKQILIDGIVRGPLNDLQIPSLSINAFGEGVVSISGSMTNITDPDRFGANLTINQLSTTDRALKGLLPKGTLPENITLPKNMNISGRIAGNMQNLNLNLKGNTSMGNLAIAGTIAQFTKPESARYDLTASMSDFALGRLLQQDSLLGNTTFSLAAKGTGFDPKTMVAAANGRVDKLEYNGYNYTNLVFDAEANAGKVVYNADMDDPNAEFTVQGTADLLKAAPAFSAKLNASRIDLLQLNLLSDTLVISGSIKADVPQLDMDRLTGSITVTDLQLGTGSKVYLLDTIFINAVNADSLNSLTLLSSIGEAAIAGRFSYDKIPAAFQYVIDQYFDIGETDSLFSNQQIGFAARLFGNAQTNDLLPQLTFTDTISIAGNLIASPPFLAAVVSLPSLSYEGSSIRAANLTVGTQGDQLVWQAEVNGLTAAAINIPKAKVNGSVGDNTIAFDAAILDPIDTTRYRIAGNLKTDYETYSLSLNPGEVILNYDPWTVSENNLLAYSDAGLYVNNLKLSHQEQSLTLQSNPASPNAKLLLSFGNFQVATITDILQQDSLRITGLINGTVGLDSIKTAPLLTGDLTVSDLAVSGDTLGNLALNARQNSSNNIDAELSLKGFGNDLSLNGSYDIAKQYFDGELDVRRLYLPSVEGLTMGTLRDMNGVASGKFDFKGTITEPSLNGSLNFDTASFRVKQFNALYRLNDETIRVDNNYITFNQFTIRDSANHEAIIDGNIDFRSFSDIGLGLQFQADDFRLLNSTAQDNEAFYGRLNFDADMTIGGTVTAPNVEGSLRINENTDFTFVLPNDDPEVSQREGIVEFFDQDIVAIDSPYTAIQKSINTASATGIYLLADVEVDKEAKFTVVVDAANGDFLDIQGDGNLSAAMDRNGEITLTGSFELTSGSYSMTLTLLQREFVIEKGSSLTWQGAPTDAKVDITAIYSARAAPIDLLGNQIGNLSPLEKEIYKQRLPFDVRLTMTGDLLKPEISFDIVLPEGNYIVSGEVIDATRVKLEQIRREPAELNKQVLSLLALGRFVADDPFSSGSSTSYAVLARQSVSKLLTEQINNLAGSLIKGVDINVGIDSEDDYTTGSQETRTDLKLGVSKTLLNDRLKITVGSNFQLEGPQLEGQQTSNLAGDIQLDYMLSRDGRYLIRAYRRDQYQVTLQGQVVETGVGFIMNVEYDKFKELFQSARQKRQLRKQRRAEKENENNNQ